MITITLTLLSILPLLFSASNPSANGPSKVLSYVTDPIPSYPDYEKFENIAKSNHAHKVLDCPDGYITEYCEISKAPYTSYEDVYLYKTMAHFVSGHTANIKGEKQENGEKYNDCYLSWGYIHVAAYQYKGLEYGGEVTYIDQFPESSKSYTVTYENGEIYTFTDTKMAIGSLYAENQQNKHWEAAWSYRRNENKYDNDFIGDYTLTTYVRFKMTNSVSYFQRDAFQNYINYSFTCISLKQKFFTQVYEDGKTYTSQGGRDYFI